MVLTFVSIRTATYNKCSAGNMSFFSSSSSSNSVKEEKSDWESIRRNDPCTMHTLHMWKEMKGQFGWQFVFSSWFVSEKVWSSVNVNREHRIDGNHIRKKPQSRTYWFVVHLQTQMDIRFTMNFHVPTFILIENRFLLKQMSGLLFCSRLLGLVLVNRTKYIN